MEYRYSETASNYLHHLHDVLVLLGSDVRFANLLKNPEEISESDVTDLRCYVGKLIDATKDKLVNINTLRVRVKQD